MEHTEVGRVSLFCPSPEGTGPPSPRDGPGPVGGRRRTGITCPSGGGRVRDGRGVGVSRPICRTYTTRSAVTGIPPVGAGVPHRFIPRIRSVTQDVGDGTTRPRAGGWRRGLTDGPFAVVYAPDRVARAPTDSGVRGLTPVLVPSDQRSFSSTWSPPGTYRGSIYGSRVPVGRGDGGVRRRKPGHPETEPDRTVRTRIGTRKDNLRVSLPLL